MCLPCQGFDGPRGEFGFGFHHAPKHSLGQFDPGFLGTVVVLSRADVATTAVEVQVHATGILLLAPSSRQATEIGTHPAIAVVTHRVTRVVVRRDQFLLSAIKGDRLENRVDQSLGVTLMLWLGG